MDVTNTIELFNKIRNDASDQFRARIPEATEQNMDEIRYAMLEDGNVNVANEFMQSLMNVLIKVVVIDKKFVNPLAPLKQGKKPLGDTVEEIYANFVTADDSGAFDGTKLFEQKLPDVKTIFHRMNLELQYPTTINRTKLKNAFKSWEDLDSFINTTISKLYDSAELDEFHNMKRLFKSAVENNAIVKVEVNNPFSNPKAFIEQVKNISSDMKYPKTCYNAYLTAQDTDTRPITTLTRYKDQILILPESVNNTIDVNILAASFNMPLVEFNKTQKVLVDEIPVENCYGALVDKKWFQVWDDYNEITQFFNAKGLYNNYYLNIGQTMAYSPLVNAVLFVGKTAVAG